MRDLIDRRAAIDVAREELESGTYFDIPSKIESLPSAQPKSVNLKIEKIKKHRANFSDLDEFEPCEAKEMNDIISRQAAIDALEKVANLFPYKVPGDRDTYGTYNEAWNDAIGRAEMEMETVPSAQPTQPNTPNTLESLDCISRQAAIDGGMTNDSVTTW